MGNYLNVGNDGFRSMTNGIYVDKTELIAFINQTLGTTDRLTCVSRPRRFGKSYAAQMLCAYYDRSCDSEGLFEGYRIAGDPSFRKHLNQYDVIYLDITWFISIVDHIRDTVLYLQEKVMEELYLAYPEAKGERTLPETLARINGMTGRKFIVIIDEWDAFFREAKEDHTLQEEYIRLLRGLFKSSGLTDRMIAGAYMTGILPIKKYGTQSAITDFREYTMIAPKRLAEYVGFTEPEVRELCQRYHMDFAEAKRWYDGYSFSRIQSVYSPNSVIEAIKNEEFGDYWTQTETYASLQVYIDLDEDGLKEAIVQMLGGARIRMDVGTFQNDMTSIRQKDDVLTLLIHLGYLAYDSTDKSVFIPNEEVHQEFVRAVSTGRHQEVARLIRNSDLLLERTLNMDEEGVAAAIEEAHRVGTSPLFYNNEQALRSVIRFAYISCVDEFIRIEELASGKGYADVVFFPKRASSMPVLLIELKWDKTEDGAISQIRRNHYPEVLADYGGDILLVGINYHVKSQRHCCKIERYRMGHIS
ncbi:MAG: AAA family ATPase [Lachnospiraceae bacterium]|nr:AAA family ATPase [Lachnospiraceae bacterium]